MQEIRCSSALVLCFIKNLRSINRNHKPQYPMSVNALNVLAPEQSREACRNIVSGKFPLPTNLSNGT